jgi:hypothetical protein
LNNLNKSKRFIEKIKMVRGENSKNYHPDELLAFFTAVESRKETLFSNLNSADIREKVRKAWLAVQAECVDNGFDRFQDKTVKQMRENICRGKINGVMSKYGWLKITHFIYLL